MDKYFDAFIKHRDSNNIEELRVSKNKLTLTLKNNKKLVFPKDKELHRFMILGKR